MIQTCIGIQVNYLLFLSYRDKTIIFSKDIRKILKYKISFME
jgi:hypothetical protein